MKKKGYELRKTNPESVRIYRNRAYKKQADCSIYKKKKIYRGVIRDWIRLKKRTSESDRCKKYDGSSRDLNFFYY